MHCDLIVIRSYTCKQARSGQDQDEGRMLTAGINRAIVTERSGMLRNNSLDDILDYLHSIHTQVVSVGRTSYSGAAPDNGERLGSEQYHGMVLDSGPPPQLCSALFFTAFLCPLCTEQVLCYVLLLSELKPESVSCHNSANHQSHICLETLLDCNEL